MGNTNSCCKAPTPSSVHKQHTKSLQVKSDRQLSENVPRKSVVRSPRKASSKGKTTSAKGTKLVRAKSNKVNKKLELQLSKRTLQLFHNIEEQVSHEDVRKIYNLGKVIGGGHFGKVRIAHLLTDSKKKYAVKSIAKESIKKDLKLLEAELSILKELDHPNIVKFYEVYSDETNYHIVMELCTGGELLERVMKKGKLSEATTAPLMRKILSAVKHLHELGICHRDLKPENFLFETLANDAEIKIVDFGLSKKFGKNAKMTTIVGTPYYVAPEVLKGNYDKSCDLWSIGVILYVLLSGYPPFDGDNKKEIFKEIIACRLQFPDSEWKNISDEAKNLIRGLITTDPKKRFTAEEALQHPWITKFAPDVIDKVVNREVLLRLQKLKKLKQFQVEALIVLINCLVPNEIKESRSTFEALDTNNKGMLGLEELQYGFDKCEIPLMEGELEIMMARADFDGNGIISYSEFLIATLDFQKMLEHDKLLMVFKHFDTDGKGKINMSTLEKIFQREGRPMTMDRINEILGECSNSTELNFEEFSKIMENIVA